MDFNNQYQLLQEVYRGAKMGDISIRLLLPKVDNARFRSDLQTQFRQYQATASNAENQMKAMGRCPKEVTNGKYALLWLSLQGNTLCNRETSHLAEMMIQGSSMGITEAVKKLHQYENDVEKDIKKLMERLQEFEEENVEKLKEFLWELRRRGRCFQMKEVFILRQFCARIL